MVRLLRAYDVDLGLCTTFPWRLSAEAIAVPRLGIVNGHPSLLPHYRGPFPIAWAVRNGESEIGMSYHLMDATLDTGNLLAQQTVPLEDEDTFESLLTRLAPVAAELLPIAFEPARARRPRRSAARRRLPERVRGRLPRTSTCRSLRRPCTARRAPGASCRRSRTAARSSSANGTRSRLVETSLAEVDGAERLDCADGPLWILETEDV